MWNAENVRRRKHLSSILCAALSSTSCHVGGGLFLSNAAQHELVLREAERLKEEELQRNAERLEELQRRRESDEAQSTRALRELALRECRIKLNGFQEKANTRTMQCAQEFSKQSECVSNNSERAAAVSVGSCALGILGALLSFGVGAPLAVGACAVGIGVGAAMKDECPDPTCDRTQDQALLGVLRDEGLAALPSCTNEQGFGVSALEERAAAGLIVERVLPGSYAEKVGVQPHDTLIRVGLMPISAEQHIAAALTSVQAGDHLRVAVVRDNQLFELEGGTTRRASASDADSRARLGIVTGAPVSDISYKSGLKVISLTPASPAAAVLQVGDVILSIKTPCLGEPAQPHSEQELDDELQFVHAGDTIILTLQRSGTRISERFVAQGNAGDQT